METQNRAWIYTRIDAPEDAHGMLKTQEKELMDYAENLGLTIVGGSSDLDSGMEMNRPGLAGMVKAAEQGQFDILLVKNLSRIGRDTALVIAAIRELERHGVETLSPLEGKISAVMLAPLSPMRLL